MHEELKQMTNNELCKLKAEILAILVERSRKEEESARQEMIHLIDKWSEKDIVFYVHDDMDHKIYIYPRELCVERGWI